jgi:hypothetical protein
MNTMVALPILGAAPTVAPAMPATNTDDALIVLANAFISSLKAYDAAIDHETKIQEDFLDSAPADLNVQSQDADFGFATWDGRTVWNAPVDIDRLRAACDRRLAGAERAAEIVKVYAVWAATRATDPGLEAAKKHKRKAELRSDELEKRVGQTHANGVQGLSAKARCVDAMKRLGVEDFVIGDSIINDLLVIGARAAI